MRFQAIQLQENVPPNAEEVSQEHNFSRQLNKKREAAEIGKCLTVLAVATMLAAIVTDNKTKVGIFHLFPMVDTVMKLYGQGASVKTAASWSPGSSKSGRVGRSMI